MFGTRQYYFQVSLVFLRELFDITKITPPSPPSHFVWWTSETTYKSWTLTINNEYSMPLTSFCELLSHISYIQLHLDWFVTYSFYQYLYYDVK